MDMLANILEKLDLGRPQRLPAEIAMREVDVVAQLERRANANPQKLDWRASIIDLLKLLDLDSSLDARKVLARELAAPQREMDDPSRMNLWVHQRVLERIAAEGGNVPAGLID